MKLIPRACQKRSYSIHKSQAPRASNTLFRQALIYLLSISLILCNALFAQDKQGAREMEKYLSQVLFYSVQVDETPFTIRKAGLRKDVDFNPIFNVSST